MIEYRKHEQRGDNLGQAIKHTTLYYTKRVIFGGYLMTALMLLLQIAILFVMFFWLDKYYKLYYEGSVLLGLIAMVYVLNDENNPAYKISWLTIILPFPLVGILLYLYTKYNFGTVAMKKIALEFSRATRKYAQTSETVKEQIKEDTDLEKFSYYLEKRGGAATYSNSGMEYFALGDHVFEPILEQLKKAEKFIFIEFFMVEEGIFFNSILEVLEEKAKEGVEIRFLYDDFGCAALLPRKYEEMLREKGINARVFFKVYPLLSAHYNNRDHRKIIVIDGKVAFTGGINLCDEYINKFEKYGHWKDNAVMVTGEAVKGFTLLFMQTWNSDAYTTEKDYESYLQSYPVKNETGYVIPYGDGPYQKENVAESVYLDILSNAKKYVYIMTPYLILDHEMESAIVHAARSGIDIRIILPHIPDKKTAFYIARTFYPKLIACGVKVYEYRPGFIHSKTFLCDDKVATVGTVNLDFRSLYLHYECGCFFYKKHAIMEIRRDFDETFEKCIRVTRDYYEIIPLWQRAAGRILRIFGPIM